MMTFPTFSFLTLIVEFSHRDRRVLRELQILLAGVGEHQGHRKRRGAVRQANCRTIQQRAAVEEVMRGGLEHAVSLAGASPMRTNVNRQNRFGDFRIPRPDCLMYVFLLFAVSALSSACIL